MLRLFCPATMAVWLLCDASAAMPTGIIALAVRHYTLTSISPNMVLIRSVSFMPRVSGLTLLLTIWTPVISAMADSNSPATACADKCWVLERAKNAHKVRRAFIGAAEGLTKDEQQVLYGPLAHGLQPFGDNQHPVNHPEGCRQPCGWSSVVIGFAFFYTVRAGNLDHSKFQLREVESLPVMAVRNRRRPDSRIILSLVMPASSVLLHGCRSHPATQDRCAGR